MEMSISSKAKFLTEQCYLEIDDFCWLRLANNLQIHELLRELDF